MTTPNFAASTFSDPVSLPALSPKLFAAALLNLQRWTQHGCPRARLQAALCLGALAGEANARALPELHDACHALAASLSGEDENA